MSNHPLLIDNVAFAKRNEHLAGELSLNDLPRLAELLESHVPDIDVSVSKKHFHKADAKIEFVLDGKVDAIGRNFLHLALRLSMATYCQRCLESMPLELNLGFDYLISDVPLDDYDMAEVEDGDEYDLQAASKAMDLMALIEDEVIMATPMAPVHDEPCTQNTMQSGEKPNPFAALKSLIKS